MCQLKDVLTERQDNREMCQLKDVLTERQANRETCRVKDVLTERQANREMCQLKDVLTGRQANREMCQLKDVLTERQIRDHQVGCRALYTSASHSGGGPWVISRRSTEVNQKTDYSNYTASARGKIVRRVPAPIGENFLPGPSCKKLGRTTTPLNH
ncbi:hypothetical protein Btru_055775 [Bulinus truncatus]|nr:hypothetical protein Btru_055775 [Bulinus truncatus]